MIHKNTSNISAFSSGMSQTIRQLQRGHRYCYDGPAFERTHLTSSCSCDVSTEEESDSEEKQAPSGFISASNPSYRVSVGPTVELVSGQNASILSFTTHSTAESAQIFWQFFVVEKSMIIYIPEGLQRENGFKEGLVALLEHGEETLGCTQAVTVLERDRADKDALLRMFMFLGFSLLPPKSAPEFLTGAIDSFLLLHMDFLSDEM